MSMVNPNYIQTERVDPSRNSNSLRIIGTILGILSLGFLISAFYVSKLMFIGFGVLAASGFVLIVLNNRRSFAFTYAIDDVCLVISKEDMVRKQSRMLMLELKDIEDYSIFMDVVQKGDIIACPNIQATNVKQIVFKEMNESRRLLFSPDTYLDSLIKMYINGRKGI